MDLYLGLRYSENDMDYHFISPPEDSTRSSDFDWKKHLSIVKKLTPIFILSAILPLFLVFISSPAETNFLTRANDDSELRIWFEPSTIVATKSTEVTLDVVASFESEKKILPKVEVNVFSDNLTILNEKVVYSRPFTGKVVLGSVTVIPEQTGESLLTIPKGAINVIAYDEPLNIITSSAKIIVK